MSKLEVHGRRSPANAIPANLNRILTREQKFMLGRLASHGWDLAFVRRPADETPVVVMHNSKGDRYCAVEGNGAAVRDPALPMRRIH